MSAALSIGAGRRLRRRAAIRSTAGARRLGAMRATLRLAALVAWTSATFVALVGARILHTASERAGDRARRRAFRTWARGTARLLGMTIDVSGARPDAPFLLVANHLGYLDVVALAAVVDVDFVAKADVAGWPAIGTLCRLVDTVFIDRRRKRDLVRVLAVLERRIAAGRSVVVFPEGTTSDGSDVLPFKSSLFELAIRAGCPAHVASLSYATPHDGPHPAIAVCWWGEMELAPHLLEMMRLPGLRARIDFAAAPLFAPDRKRLARAAHRAVRAQFQPVSQGDPSWFPASA